MEIETPRNINRSLASTTLKKKFKYHCKAYKWLNCFTKYAKFNYSYNTLHMNSKTQGDCYLVT